ncbi:MAG: hypothetical protein IT386_14195, partial [Deltaproteobacteria bacterium]|nr:hypothetical protein [Deltaproteobacteria bacterium]
MRGHLVARLRTALLSALLAVVAPCAPALALPTRAIVLSGEPVPGLPGQTFGAVYGYPSASGYVAISGNTSAGKAGVWLWDETTGGSPTPVAVPGPAPALSGLEISRAFVREMTSSGRLGYQASLTTGAGGVTSFTNTYLGIYDPASGHSIVAREGDPAPGIPGHALVLDALADALPQFNAAGQALFTAVTFGGTPVFGGGLWRYDPPGVVTPIVTATSDVPSIGIPNIVDLNDAGELAYAASTGSVGGYAIRGPDGAGGTYEVVRTQALAPGTPSPGVVSWIPGGGSFSLNESGQLAFSAQLLAGIGDVTTANDWS